MFDFETLMAPLDGPSPVGPDLRSQPDFRDIEDMPGDFANQKAPELRQAVAVCEAFLERTKDQMPLIVAVQAAVRIGDFALVNAGLLLIKGFTDVYWDDFHPGPAGEMVIGRINELSALSRPAAMVLPLQRAAIAQLPAPSMTSFNAAMIAQSCVPTREWSDQDEEALKARMESGQVTGAAARAIRPNREGGRQLRMVMRVLSSAARQADTEADIDMDDSEFDPAARYALALNLRDQVSATRDALMTMSNTIYEINEIYDSRSGDSASLGPVLSTIKSIMDDADRFLALYPQTEAVGDEVAAAADEMPARQGGAPAPPVKDFTASVPRNRDDVKAALDAICAYYAVNEPSSPVILALKRARTWINKDFMELVAELIPNALDDAEKLLASRAE